MQHFTFKDYREAMDSAGPKLREIILWQAEHDKNIPFPDFIRLCKPAYPETV